MLYDLEKELRLNKAKIAIVEEIYAECELNTEVVTLEDFANDLDEIENISYN